MNSIPEPKKSFREILTFVDSQIRETANILQTDFEIALTDSAYRRDYETNDNGEREWKVILNLDKLALEMHKVVSPAHNAIWDSYFPHDLSVSSFGLDVIRELCGRFKIKYVDSSLYEHNLVVNVVLND
jgi:hypothetical protein